MFNTSLLQPTDFCTLKHVFTNVLNNNETLRCKQFLFQGLVALNVKCKFKKIVLLVNGTLVSFTKRTLINNNKFCFVALFLYERFKHTKYIIVIQLFCYLKCIATILITASTRLWLIRVSMSPVSCVRPGFKPCLFR